MVELILNGVLVGLGATLAMDVWAVLVGLLPGQSGPNWALPGRWFREVSRGRVVHDDIAAAPLYVHEVRLGWIGHYAVGVVYGVVFALIMGPGWFAAPTFLPAWIFAIVTIAAGWFLMQPAMGLGWAASATPDPRRARVMGLLAHTAFGVGLWGSAVVVG